MEPKDESVTKEEDDDDDDGEKADSDFEAEKENPEEADIREIRHKLEILRLQSLQSRLTLSLTSLPGFSANHKNLVTDLWNWTCEFSLSNAFRIALSAKSRNLCVKNATWVFDKVAQNKNS